MAKSGGVTARNTRQGFRSEYIARFIFSAFGPAVEVSQGNDIGLDLLCNLTEFNGHLIVYKSSYGVQVKSIGTKFIYQGKQATKWLSLLEYPLLLATIDKPGGRIQIYSTWCLNKYILSLNSDEENSFPECIEFATGLDDFDSSDIAKGIIPVGKPILDFEYSEIDDAEKFEHFYKVLSEWLSFDNENYLIRRAGIPIVFGYTKWESNKGLDLSQRLWSKEVYYSPFHSNKTHALIAKALISIGLFNKENFYYNRMTAFRDDFNELKRFADRFLAGHLDDFGRGVFDKEIEL